MSYLLKGVIEDLARLNPQELVFCMLKQAHHHEHGLAEQASWRNSLYRLIQYLQKNHLGQLYLIAEYSLLDKRIDALLFGYKKGTTESLTTIIELKQWQALATNFEQRVTEVNVQIGQGTDYRIHPIFQTEYYKKQLENHHPYFQGRRGAIKTIQYLDQFEDDKAKFFEPPYQDYYSKEREHHLIVKKEMHQLIKSLTAWYETEQINQQLLEKEVKNFLQGHYVMGDVGLSGIKQILSGQDNAIMLDDQQEVSAQVSLLFKGYHQKPQPMTIIIQGDPGTGKTIVGLHLLYLAQKRGISSQARCLITFAKSRMLLEVLRQESGLTTIPYIDQINPHHYDLIIIDEAHRLPNPQATLTRCLASGQNKLIIFLVDDHQRIRLDEQGSVAALTQASETLGISPHTFTLRTQKRSGFKHDYVNMVKHLLYGNLLPEQPYLGDFQLHVRLSLPDIDQELLRLREQGHTVKWFAPYCWEWQSRSKPAATDILIKNFEKQWNPFNNQYDWYKGNELCYFNQVGSIYTAQGLDYDYIGLIWWSDLKWNKLTQTWDINLDLSKDKQFKDPLLTYLKQQNQSQQAMKTLVQLILNQYYILLTRAKKGIYLWFNDQDTQEHVQQLLADQNQKL